MSPTKKTAIERGSVLKGLYALDFHKRGVDVTADDVAAHLEVPLDAVSPLLRRLKKIGVVRRTRRGGQVVWMPAKGQRA